jgi:hypothetical protein
MVEIDHFQRKTPLIALDRKIERDSCAPAVKVPGIFHRLSLPASASQIEDVLQSALHALSGELDPYSVASASEESIIAIR